MTIGHLKYILMQNITQQKIRRENKQLRDLIDSYLQEIQRLKSANQQHQSQINTLLEYNQRLVAIIDVEMRGQKGRKSERAYSLQPISEITEKDSEPMEVPSKNAVQINIRLNEIEDRKEMLLHRTQTDRFLLGQHLQDQYSYEVSKSDYQKQYSEYSHKQKVKQIKALINSYKQEYGNSIQECQDTKTKIKSDYIHSNKQLESLNENNQKFYESKKQELDSLKQRLRQNSTQSQLQGLLSSNKYSPGTQTKLMEIMRQIN